MKAFDVAEEATENNKKKRDYETFKEQLTKIRHVSLKSKADSMAFNFYVREFWRIESDCDVQGNVGFGLG